MAAKTILAVAIGDNSKNKIIKDGSSVTLSGVRPYIKGIINKLTRWGDRIGDAGAYVIDYRECTLAQLPGIFSAVRDGSPPPHIIFCMSTTVLNAAVAAPIRTTPLVGIVSKHNTYGTNVFGVSARRSHIARRYYEHFLDTVPSLTTQLGAKIYILHKPNYQPAEDSLGNINTKALPVPIDVRPVASPYGETEIKNAIDGITSNSGGLMLLPVDHFFGAAEKIIGWARAKTLPDFWPVTDWVQDSPSSALGGYGASQERSGELLGDKFHELLNGAVPDPRFTDITHDANFRWLASVKAAASLPVVLGPHVPTV